MTFVQAQIKIGNEAGFAEFQSVLENAFSAANVAAFLQSVERKGLRVRQFEQVRDAGLLDRYRGGKSVSALWNELALADQGQVRERYLTRVEEVAPEIRQRFAKLYQYA